MKKRIFSLLLVLILAASALNITASAYSDYASGIHKGNRYTASINVSKEYIRSGFSYAGGGNVEIWGYSVWNWNNIPGNYRTNISTSDNDGNVSLNYAVDGTRMVITKGSLTFLASGVVCTLTESSY